MSKTYIEGPVYSGTDKYEINGATVKVHKMIKGFVFDREQRYYAELKCFVNDYCIDFWTGTDNNSRVLKRLMERIEKDTIKHMQEEGIVMPEPVRNNYDDDTLPW